MFLFFEQPLLRVKKIQQFEEATNFCEKFSWVECGLWCFSLRQKKSKNRKYGVLTNGMEMDHLESDSDDEDTTVFEINHRRYEASSIRANKLTSL